MKPGDRPGGAMQRGADRASEELPGLDKPWDQGDLIDGWDPRSPHLIRALLHNREVAQQHAARLADVGRRGAAIDTAIERGMTIEDAHRADALLHPTVKVTARLEAVRPLAEPVRPVERPADPEPDKTIPPRTACHLWRTGLGYCGSTDNVHAFVFGPRCGEHSPPQPTPDPRYTIEGLRAAKGLPPPPVPKPVHTEPDEPFVRGRRTPSAYREARERWARS